VPRINAGFMTNNKRSDVGSAQASTTPPTGSAEPNGKVQLSARTPEDVLAVVPHMLGFYPSRSLVVLGLGERSRVVVTFRYDLPDPFDYDVASDIAQHADYVLRRERLGAALLIGYGPADLVVRVAAITSARLSTGGVDVSEVLRADGGRFWSLLCDDVACCPPEGRSYDPGSHPAAATLTQAGLPAEPDRDALARTIRRPAGSAERVRRATVQAQLRLRRLTDLGEAAADPDPRLRATRTGRREVQRAIRQYRAGETITSVDHLAWLAVLLADIRVRDDAWARMDPAHRIAHGRLWTDVLRCADVDFLAPAASLLAFTAWQSGNGALATISVERALTADPGYSMAQLLAGAIEAVLPPSAARMPMTPAAVAASYAPLPCDRIDKTLPGDQVPEPLPGNRPSKPVAGDGLSEGPPAASAGRTGKTASRASTTQGRQAGGGGSSRPARPRTGKRRKRASAPGQAGRTR
jgi:hypothetical protein